MRELLSHGWHVLQKNLDLRHQRQRVLNSNVANADTPGFIAKDVRFEDALRSAAKPTSRGPLNQTHAGHFPPSAPALDVVEGRLVAKQSDNVGRDVNTVSIEREMAALNANTMHYNASTNILGRLIGSLRRTINEGRTT